MSSGSTSFPRHYGFGRYLRQRFGCKVHKVTLHAGFTCPNRDGSRGSGGCTFCNNNGFSPNTRVDPTEVGEQLRSGIERLRQHRAADKFIAYFQAYTNTYSDPERLAEFYDQVWRFPDVVGMSVGTRPDCVDARKLDLIASYLPRGEIWVEYGLQSSHDATLKRINRGHSFSEFLRAIELTAGRGIRICVHTILGLPGETREMMLETHRRLADLPIDGLKIHLLHVMRDTAMARQHARGEIKLLGRSEFVGLACDVLEVVRPNVVIQRMHADAPRDVLVGPEWCLDKRGVLADIRDELLRRDSWQGKALGYCLQDLANQGMARSGS